MLRLLNKEMACCLKYHDRSFLDIIDLFSSVNALNRDIRGLFSRIRRLTAPNNTPGEETVKIPHWERRHQFHPRVCIQDQDQLSSRLHTQHPGIFYRFSSSGQAN